MSDICRSWAKDSDAAYVLGALSPADRREYEDHLRDCADCRSSVQRLAGLPGLLALTTAAAIEDPEPEVPPTILPKLLERARAERRRRQWVFGGLLAASIAALLVLVGVLVTQQPEQYDEAAEGSASTSSVAPSSGTLPSGTATSTPPAVDQDMTQLLPGPMTASVELADRRWGTSITVVCQYSEQMDSDVAYDLAVIDVEGHSSDVGAWRAVPGANYRIPAATSLTRDRIAALEVRLPDGEPILRSTL